MTSHLSLKQQITRYLRHDSPQLICIINT